MKSKTQKNMLKAMGATLAVCSAVAMISSSKSNGEMAKKAMKKTADKVMDFVDTISTFM